MIRRVASFFRLPPVLAAALSVLVLSGSTRAEITVDPPQPTPRRTFDPSDVYFQGYLTARDAETLESQGDIVGAHDKLKRAKEMFDAIRLYYPDWKPDMVKDRGAVTNESIAKIEPRANELRLKKQKIVAELEGGVKSSGEIIDPTKDAKPLGSVDLPKPIKPDTAKDRGKPVIPPTSTPAPLKPLPVAPIQPTRQVDPMESQKIAQLEAEIIRLQKQLREGPKDMADASRLQSQKRDIEIQRDQALTELSRAQSELNALRARLAAAPVESDYKSLNDQIASNSQEREALNRALTQSRDQLANEKVKNATLQADLAVARQKQSNLQRDFDRQHEVANSVVEGMKNQMKDLETLLKQKDAELIVADKKIEGLTKQLSASQKAYSELQVERDSLLREKEQMSALLKLNESGRIQDLIEQNMTLAKTLREAQERVKQLGDESNQDKDLYIEALRDLAIAKSQIGRLQADRAEQDKHLKELEARLKQEEEALASGSVNSEEVKTLRDIIKRQLQVQNRRRQAREELVQAAKQLGTDNPSLSKAIDLFDGSDDVTLTPAEQKLIADNKSAIPIFVGGGRPRAADVDGAMSDATKDSIMLDNVAKKAFGAGRLTSAKELYQESVEVNPGNIGALCKLGFIQLKIEDYPSAVDSLRRATEMDGSNPYAHRMLGVALFRLGDLTGAEQSLLKAIELAPDDAQAHLVLGNIYLLHGRATEAESENRAAMMADPALPDPYYNLAVFCAKAGRKEEGKRLYMKALELHALPDIALEKKLGL